AVFVCNALAPAEVMKVVMDEDETRIKVIVDEDQLSLAIGRRGQNVRLASELTGWKIDIITEREEAESRVEEFGAIAREFMERLDLDEEVATSLVQEGFTTLEEVAYVPLEELAGIDGFDEEIARELRTRARDQLLHSALENEERKAALSIDPRISQLRGLTDTMVIAVAEKGITQLDDLADLSTDELLEMISNGLSRKDVERVILQARELAGWFEE
ncbi:MAG: transcription termination/antitermination protein NusA, partial [Magnetococcales bacterium]|nr:transcription termination/antitermination protein NusA [Magnetococcales bacterium]